MRYLRDGNTAFVVTYKRLREWAGECEAVKAWMAEHLPAQIFEEAPETTYKLGQRFIVDHGGSDTEYILATPDERHVFLINITNGFGWRHPVRVESLGKITEEEMRQIGGDTYKWRLKK